MSTMKRDWTGHRFATKDRRRTVIVVREEPDLYGERMFRVRTINYPDRPDLIGRESTVTASGLTRKYVPIEFED